MMPGTPGWSPGRVGSSGVDGRPAHHGHPPGPAVAGDEVDDLGRHPPVPGHRGRRGRRRRLRRLRRLPPLAGPEVHGGGHGQVGHDQAHEQCDDHTQAGYDASGGCGVPGLAGIALLGALALGAVTGGSGDTTQDLANSEPRGGSAAPERSAAARPRRTGPLAR